MSPQSKSYRNTAKIFRKQDFFFLFIINASCYRCKSSQPLCSNIRLQMPFKKGCGLTCMKPQVAERQGEKKATYLPQLQKLRRQKRIEITSLLLFQSVLPNVSNKKVKSKVPETTGQQCGKLEDNMAVPLITLGVDRFTRIVKGIIK